MDLEAFQKPLVLRCTLALALSGAPAFAQGNNDCSTATPIVGAGTYVVSTIGATDSPQQPGQCPTIHRDVWFVWTAAATENVDVSLCGGVSSDTVLAVYAGSACPVSGSEVACSDDYCNYTSLVNFDAVAGTEYLIQIGAWNASTTFSGTFYVGPPLPCGTNTGPDVIVGDLQEVANYATQSISGVDYDAVAFGTYSCNIGDTWLNWIANTNQHPVIASNLYKYKVVDGAGRIEQIGMSWLKHGFYALSDNLCCTGCQSTDGTHLGVHCSDPYSAPRNGTQAGLGPRWEVNAATGVFAYPPANPSYSGSAARRCQVKVSDLEASSASVHYFAEGQYVTPDDAAAGNAYNNASYRELSVTGGGSVWQFALLAGGETVRENPAIRAWQAAEAGVQVTNIDIAGDGRLVLAWKVTNLGGGKWHYEYALFNLNSDLSVQALSVPKPDSVTLTNIAFHDIGYHDGDGPGNVNLDGSDWVATNGASSLDWATSTFAQNPSANALRWGTLYNFRCDANAPPVSGTLTLSTFKTVGSVQVQADVPGEPLPGPYCFGDGTGPVPCPCSNPGAAGHGCANSANPAGALLAESGTTSPDTLELTSYGELPHAFSVMLQAHLDFASPVIFGDGLRCVGGNFKRLYSINAVSGVAVFPPPASPSISAQSAAKGDPIAPGSTRCYQVYYRDPNALYCPVPTGSTFNVGNALRILW